MNKLNFLNKVTGDTLEATEWNSVVSKVDEIVESINNGGGGGGSSSEGSVTPIDTSGIITVSGKGNVTLGSAKNVNLEPAWDNGNPTNYLGEYGDIALKPGDDILFCSHHREPKKRDKIVVKAIDGSDNPVKLQAVAGEIELAVGTTKNPKIATKKKNKTTGADTEETLFKASDAKVLDVKILTGTVLDSGQTSERDERGYLKVRAQAIDLRCEKHGGIALQPKGYDNDGNMNKIKFEHGGGDGLEFGTFNAEKTSIFTDEYRFKKDGIWKMATRETEASGKDIIDEGTIPTGKSATGLLKYKKNNAANNQAKTLADLKTYEAPDDFYDFIDTEDVQTTTESIIKTAAALNNDYIETSLSSKKNLSIGAKSTYKIIAYTGVLDGNELTFVIDDLNKSYFKDDLKLILSGTTKLSDYIDTKLPFLVDGVAYRLSGDITPKVALESEEEVDLDAKYGDVVITSGDTIKCEAPEIRLNAINKDKSGGMVNFGATQDVVFLTNKLTKSLNVEAAANPTKIKLQLQNNYQEPVFWDSSINKFRIPLKKIYLDNQHTEELTPSNYANGLAVYFEDGTRVPADYTCFMGYTQSGNTSIYKVGTKGSGNVLKKTLGNAVATYTGTTAQTLGTEVTNSISNIKFELSTYDGQGTTTVAPEEFVSVSEVSLEDIITLVNYFKTGGGVANGPWAQ